MIKQLKNFSHRLIVKIKEENLKGKVIRNSISSFVIRITGTFLAFLLNVLLARFLGSTEFGIYAYVIAWISLLTIPSSLGLNKLMVRDLSIYYGQSNWKLMRGLLYWSTKIVTLSSIVIGIVATFITWLLSTSGQDFYTLAVFGIGCLSLPIAVITLVRQGALQGIHHVGIGQIPESIVRPLLIMLFLVIVYFLQIVKINALWGISFYVIAAGITMVIGTVFLSRRLPKDVIHAEPEYQWKTWLVDAIPFMMISGMNVLNNRLGTLMLGSMLNKDAVAFYVVASRVTDVLSFIMLAANASLAPAFASLYAKKDMQQLQRLVTVSARIVVLCTLPIATILILFRFWILSIFGPEFVQAQMVLAILCLGQIVSVFMGSVATLLVMTEHGRDATVGVGISVVVNIVLNLFLIPLWGAEGAALSTSFSVALLNIVLGLFVYKKLGIYTTIFGKWQL